MVEGDLAMSLWLPVSDMMAVEVRPSTHHQVNPIVPPPKSATKGKVVTWWMNQPWACKVWRIESLLPDALDEILPAPGPSATPQWPLFKETPVPMGLSVDLAPVGGPVSSGEFPGGFGATQG